MIQEFYDQLSPFYHLIFEDWESSIERQAKILHQIIRNEWGPSHTTVVDVSCGIGTQAIGLSMLHYKVEASDLSSVAIKRAQYEAEKRHVNLTFSVADMRTSFEHHRKQFDVLISCDNSIPHLLSDAEILGAFKEFYRCVKPGGGCIITVRDYEHENRDGVQVKPYGVRVVDETTYIILQTWEFEENIYNLSMYFIIDHGHQEAKTKIFRSKYYAVSIAKIMELLEVAGFSAVKHITSEFYQPVIIGTR